MSELALIIYFLNPVSYEKYRHLIKEDSVQGDTLILLKLLDQLVSTQDSAPSLDELFFLARTKIEQEKCDLIFQTLRNLQPASTIEVFLKDLKRRRALEELSVLSYEASQGKNHDDKIQTLIANINEGMDETEEAEPFVVDDLNSILTEQFQKHGLRWRLNALNKSLGSLRGGDFGFFVARPETGKTTMLASEITYMASQLPDGSGPVLYFNNEEQGRKIKLKLYQAACNATLQELLGNIEKGEQRYRSVTKDNIKVIDDATIPKALVERICKKHQPSLIIFDQLDKITGFANDRDDLRLGAIYQWARELAKQYNCPVIGVTQADGTAEGVKWLNMSHVANSKTSKQAEADWIVGIGRVEAEEFNKIRYLSVLKNKLSGDDDTEPGLRHGRLECFITPEVARYKDHL